MLIKYRLKLGCPYVSLVIGGLGFALRDEVADLSEEQVKAIDADDRVLAWVDGVAVLMAPRQVPEGARSVPLQDYVIMESLEAEAEEPLPSAEAPVDAPVSSDTPPAPDTAPTDPIPASTAESTPDAPEATTTDGGDQTAQ